MVHPFLRNWKNFPKWLNRKKKQTCTADKEYVYGLSKLRFLESFDRIQTLFPTLTFLSFFVLLVIFEIFFDVRTKFFLAFNWLFWILSELWSWLLETLSRFVLKSQKCDSSMSTNSSNFNRAQIQKRPAHLNLCFFKRTASWENSTFGKIILQTAPSNNGLDGKKSSMCEILMTSFRLSLKWNYFYSFSQIGFDERSQSQNTHPKPLLKGWRFLSTSIYLLWLNFFATLDCYQKIYPSLEKLFS